MFCSLVNAIEMCKTEGVVDVFQVVKALRIQKPGAVLTVVYDILHDSYCNIYISFVVSLIARIIIAITVLTVYCLDVYAYIIIILIIITINCILSLLLYRNSIVSFLTLFCSSWTLLVFTPTSSKHNNYVAVNIVAILDGYDTKPY